MTKKSPKVRENIRFRSKRGLHIEIESASNGGLLCVIGGTKRLLHCGRDCIKLGFPGGQITLSGSSIVCRTFRSGIVEASGEIAELRFEGKEDGLGNS